MITHFQTTRKKSLILSFDSWNILTDFPINGFLIQKGLQFPIVCISKALSPLEFLWLISTKIILKRLVSQPSDNKGYWIRQASKLTMVDRVHFKFKWKYKIGIWLIWWEIQSSPKKIQYDGFALLLWLLLI